MTSWTLMNRIGFIARTDWGRYTLRCRLGIPIIRKMSTGASHYEILELPGNSTIKDVKQQFKRLSKKYHPDLNSHLSDEEKELNNNKYMEILNAYDTLKDPKKKKQYDLQIRGSRFPSSAVQRRSDEWQNKYYGEAKYYSKSGSSYTASGLNTKRHRVHNFSSYDNSSTFNGQHKNYGDRFDVPHFDYNQHLKKHLKFEQRIISKNLSEQEKEKIVRQLSKDGDASTISEELLTKHLMRNINYRQEQDRVAHDDHTAHSNINNPHMYRGPREDDDMNAFKLCMLVGGGFSAIYLLFSSRG